MFLNSESEIPSLAEITFLQFIFFDFQASFKDLLRLGINTYTMAKKAGDGDGEGSTFGPRTVTWTAIFSFLRIPKVRTV